MSAMMEICGMVDCRPVVDAVRNAKGKVALSEIGAMPDGKLYQPFDRLNTYAQANDLMELGTNEVAAYFGSGLHAEIMLRGGYRRLGQYLGRELGLVTHMLLPISEDGVYKNGGYVLKFDNLIMPKKEDFPLFCHLGVGVRFDLTKQEIQAILADQLRSKALVRALKKVNGQTVVIPDEYRKAVESTMKADR